MEDIDYLVPGTRVRATEISFHQPTVEGVISSVKTKKYGNILIVKDDGHLANVLLTNIEFIV